MVANRNPLDEADVPVDAALAPEMATADEQMGEVAAQVDIRDTLDEILEIENIAETLGDDVLAEMGAKVCEEYLYDKSSREQWEQNYGEALDLARQLYEKKTWGGYEVANIKYPIIGTAAIQFNARSYGNLVKGDRYVACRVNGRDPDGKKAARGERISSHMNYQFGVEMESWDEGMDQMLITLPLIGTCFKKTYRDHNRRINQSDYVSAEDLVVNYWAKSLESAARVTHIVELSKNDVLERIRSGLFLDIEDALNEPTGRQSDTLIDDKGEPDRSGQYVDEDAPHIFLEQHRWWDLDDDGYKEPYVVTVHKDSEQVVRVVARFDTNDVYRNEKGQIVRIEAKQYFTQYTFFPAFDGSFYRMGFGILLAPINKTVNTVINQLLDAGTLSNRQSGFIHQGLRLTKAGATGFLRFKPGEWKYVQTPGDDIRKGILPLPIKEPSAVLFQLLGLMLEASKELASQAEVLSGEQTQPNVPATTTLALIEQGLKVYSSIYKRIYRAFRKELFKLRRLNYLYTDADQYNRLLDTEQYQSPKLDYADFDLDITPISGSADISDIQRLIKAQALYELRGQGLRDEEIMRRYLEALQIDDVDALIIPPEEQQPNIQLIITERQLAQVDAQIQQKEREIDLKQQEVMIKDAEAFEKMVRTRTEALKNIAIAEGMEAGQQLDIYKAEVENFGKAVDTLRAVLEFRLKQSQEGMQANANAGPVGQMANSAGYPGSNQGIGPTARPNR